MNSRAIEFSITTIVTLIIAIIIFSLSLNLIFRFFGEASELEQEIDRQTRDQLMQALKSGNQLVLVPFAVQETKRGNFATFPLGVRNIGNEKQFQVLLGFSGAYNPDGSDLTQKNSQYIEQNWIGNFKTGPPFRLKKGDSEVRPVSFKADVNTAQGIPTPKGDYVFNVCVFAPEQPTAPPPCTPENRRLFYTEKVYQMTVRVV